MPCMCWFNPSEEDKRYIRDRCIEIVHKIKELEKIGDPLHCDLKDIHVLLDHLYSPKSCIEKFTNENNEPKI